jgi:hypothetical protein
VISRISRLKAFNVLETNIFATHREINFGGAYENGSPINYTQIIFIN